MDRLSRLRTIVVPVALLAAVLVAAQPAVAATVVGQSGLVGKFAFTDTMSQPGIACVYNPVNTNQNLSKIVVHGPKIWARNRTAHRDSQTVGWRFIIQNSQAGGAPPWQTFTTSSVVKATSHDDTGVKFGSRTWIAPKNKNVQWRVQIVMRWYKPGSSTTVQGQVKLMDEFQITVFPPNPNITNTVPCLPGQ
jgi:hypothetical protein